SRPRVTICIPTYRRPEQLERLFASLRALRLPEHTSAVEVLVIDNDPDKSAEALCTNTALPWPLRYFEEPRRGIAQARNAAIRHSGNADWIVFVDDDETVEPDWLGSLLCAQAEFRADVVAGPVLIEYRAGVSAWIIRSRLLVRRRYPTGSRPKTLGTG